MKKYAYIVAMSCVLVGAIGFASIYATSQSQQENQLSQYSEFTEETENEQQNNADKNQVALNESPQLENEDITNLEHEPNLEDEIALEVEEESDAEVGTITEEAIHFDIDGDFMWPVEGTVLLDYSMDSTIFFPTLQQYKYNPAMVLKADVNSKVYFVAKGKITNIETNEETGCTVTQDLGDGYTAIYGQLKELNFQVGDMVEAGQVLGYVSEPTKYYSVEGSNVYFKLLKDGLPVDPAEILP